MTKNQITNENKRKKITNDNKQQTTNSKKTKKIKK